MENYGEGWGNKGREWCAKSVRHYLVLDDSCYGRPAAYKDLQSFVVFSIFQICCSFAV